MKGKKGCPVQSDSNVTLTKQYLFIAQQLYKHPCVFLSLLANGLVCHKFFYDLIGQNLLTMPNEKLRHTSVNN